MYTMPWRQRLSDSRLYLSYCEAKLQSDSCCRHGIVYIVLTRDVDLCIKLTLRSDKMSLHAVKAQVFNICGIY